MGLSAPCFFLPFIFIPRMNFTILKLPMHYCFGNIRIEHAPLFIVACLIFFIRKFFVLEPSFFFAILVDITTILMKVLYNSSLDPKKFLFL